MLSDAASKGWPCLDVQLVKDEDETHDIQDCVDALKRGHQPVTCLEL